MRIQDKPKFAGIIFGLGEYKRVKVTDMSMEIYWRLLEPFDIDEIDQTILRMLADPSSSAFMPQAHEIIAALPSQKSTQWMTADETWPIVVQAYDQSATVVFPNEESQTAWFNFGEPVYSHRDQNPARMAYRSAYDRLVAEAKAAGKIPKSITSLGHDPDLREYAIQGAIQKGYLSHDRVPDALMIGHETSAIGQHIAGLIGGSTESLPKLNGNEKSRIAKLRAAMETKKTPDQVLAEYLELQAKAGGI